MARIVDGPEITGQVVHRQTGQAYGPVTVTVSPKVYTDREMTSSTTSLTTDGQGVYFCYAPPGLYTFTTTAADSGPLEPVEVLGREGGTGTPGSAAYSPFESYQPSAVPTPVILFGTSLENQNGMGVNQTDPAGNNPAGRGWFNHAACYMAHEVYITANAGVGGNLYSDMRTRLATDVLAVTGDWVYMGGPVNDVANGRDAASILADMDYMLDAIVAAGKRVLLLTAAPSVNYDTAGKRTVLDAVNAGILAARNTRQGRVIVADAYAAVGADANRNPLTGMTIDGVHFSDAAAQRVGLAAATAYRAVVPARIGASFSPFAEFPRIISNPLDSSTGWSVDPTVTATWSPGKVTAVWASNSFGDDGIYRDTAVASGLYAVGDVIQARCRVKWRSAVPTAGAQLLVPDMRIQQLGGSAPAQSAFLTAAGEKQTPVRYAKNGEIWLKTPKMTITTGVTDIYVRLFFSGIGTGIAEFSELDVVKVN